MKPILCNLCGELGQPQRLWIMPDRRLSQSPKFTLVRCARCGLVYLNPMPEPAALAHHYPPHYYSPPPAQPPAACRWRLGRIRRHVAWGKLLDVGCGTGWFLECALAQGWDAYGLDNSPAAYALAKRLGARVALTTLHEAAYPAQTFDVVSLFEVLEHVPDPVGHLKEIRRLLTAGGIVCLTVPNFASCERLVFGPWWQGLDVPRHLQQFTPRTLRTCLEAAGLAAVELRSVSASSVQVGQSRIAYCQESLRVWLRAHGWYPMGGLLDDANVAPAPARRAWWKPLVSTIERLCFEPLCLLGAALDRENSLWACARPVSP